MQTDAVLDFFLGSNSGHGFVSHFGQFQNPDSGERLFLLKGAPGTGKSGIMKKAAAEAGGRQEHIHCSSDADSLDALYLPERKLFFCDATPPHVLEPRYPGVQELLVNLTDAVDPVSAFLQKDRIVSLSEEVSGCHRSFSGQLCGVNLLFGEIRELLAPGISRQKESDFAARLARREFASLPAGTGREQIRMTAAFTPGGMTFFPETVNRLCDRLYLIRDEYRAAAPFLMEQLRQALLRKDTCFYTCRSPFHPDTETDQILVPELRLGFVTLYPELPHQEALSGRVIRAERFLSRDLLRKNRQKLSFYRKTVGELLREALESLSRAKLIHDRLEACFRPCVDFQRVDEIYEKLRQTVLLLSGS